MTVDESVVRILDLYIQNKWTKSSLTDCLTLLQEMLPENNLMPTSVYKLFQHVKECAPPLSIIKHYYCKSCFYYNAASDKVIQCQSCQAQSDICEQIKYMFEHRNLADKLKIRPRQEDVISDITDASEYCRVNARLDKQKFDLTLILNTDGLALVKSSKSHCWPLMFMIAELPQHLRESFLVVIGLWYDTDKKPPMNTFLRPFYYKLKKCFDDGVTWVYPKTQETIISKIIAPLIVADAPARAEIQNILNFNGQFGCNICEISTALSETGPGKKNFRYYPFINKNIPLRSSATMLRQAEQVKAARDDPTKENKIKHLKGVKGKSIVAKFPLLDLGTCLLPEYMHCGLLGVGRLFTQSLWIDGKGPWVIKSNLSAIHKIILKIQPPYFFNRMPRQLTLIKFHKASEFYYWILFYSLPVLIGYLQEIYLQHWILFVRALFLLLQDNIKSEDLNEADLLLRRFVKETQTLYGDRAMTYNMHQLTHLVLVVKRWGPLWATSAFPFENFNGFLASSAHYTKHLDQEMVNNLTIAQGLQVLRNKIYDSDDFQLSDTTSCTLGNCITSEKICDSDKNLLITHHIDINDVKFFSRAKINNNMYTSELYKNIKTNSYTVTLENNDNSVSYGFIKCFIEIENQLYIILQDFDIQHSKMFVHEGTQSIVEHILPVQKSARIQLIKVNNIKSISHVIRVKDYICKRPNLFKKNL